MVPEYKFIKKIDDFLIRKRDKSKYDECKKIYPLFVNFFIHYLCQIWKNKLHSLRLGSLERNKLKDLVKSE